MRNDKFDQCAQHRIHLSKVIFLSFPFGPPRNQQSYYMHVMQDFETYTPQNGVTNSLQVVGPREWQNANKLLKTMESVLEVSATGQEYTKMQGLYLQ